MADVQKPREIAFKVLRCRETGDEFVELALERELNHSKLSTRDRGLCHELVCGCVRWQAALDQLIVRKTDDRPQKPGLQILLRLGLYQLFWLDRIPAHAAVNETVNLAKRAGFGAQAGFVNAILRGYLRDQDATKQQLADLKITQPALGFSHPEWLVTRWQQNFGVEHMLRLLAWNNTPPKTYARVNTLKGEPRQLLEKWRDEDVEYDFARRDWLPENLVFELKAHPPLATLRSFTDGCFYLQDPSTLLAVKTLNPQPGEAILDLCAAPGGKTTFIAQLMNNTGKVVAYDIAAERVNMLLENCARLGVSCVEVTKSLEGLVAIFDKVLVDAPCSNTGVMRRRVDLRWRIQPTEIVRLRAMQLELLQRAAALVKPGGVIVYSTCSLESDENAEVVKEFLVTNTGFRQESERQLTPFADEVDGAFVARLVKN